MERIFKERRPRKIYVLIFSPTPQTSATPNNNEKFRLI